MVFSNFHASNLSLDATASRGVRALQAFLDYAENRNLPSLQSVQEDTESPFEDSVCDFLQNQGYEVRKQVGCAGFRVDLGIIDPQYPGRYLLGVECDGAKYHMSPVARERDRLRQQILENLGWRIHRVWSTDWYRNRHETERKLLDQLNRINSDRVEPENPASPATPPNLHDGPGFLMSAEELMQVNKDDASIESLGKEGTLQFITPNDDPELRIPDYMPCTSLGRRPSGELFEYPTNWLADMVIQVVDVEGPVHFDEVVRRIRSLWGLKRTGDRICNAISHGISWAERAGRIRRRDQFLWPAADRTVAVRRRSDDPPPTIDFICDEEIAESVKLVLNNQFATFSDALVVQSCRLLGIRATSEKTAQRISAVINNLIGEGKLQQLPNGMIDLPDYAIEVANISETEEEEVQVSPTPALADTITQQPESEETQPDSVRIKRPTKSDIYNYPSAFFKKLAHEAKVKDVLNPWERRYIYNIGAYRDQGWGLSETQEHHTLRIIEKATRLGLSLATD